MNTKFKNVYAIAICILVMIVISLLVILSNAYKEIESKKDVLFRTIIESSAPEDIVSSLTNESRELFYLVDQSGMLGGIPGFYSEDKIYEIAENRVIAYWEDGHVGGYVIVEYEDKDGQRIWKTVESYEDQRGK